MSTRTDTRRAPARRAGGGGGTAPASAKRAAAREPGTARGRAAPGGHGRAPRIPFVLLVLCLLGGALVGLLVLRSVIAQEAFVITSLQAENRELSQEEQQRRNNVAHLEASERISEEAESMGMEQGEAPLFLDPENGEIAGSAGSGE
ncbi:hypothetical protein ACFWTE_20650 [Nocardiopsis sp. NPDC058631]|uniref:hypothetical protein n=1 Tax=Nocardiopsis sp. NPDC058631 TaxID=3346566 RepID=UPI00364E3CBD